MLGLLDAGVCCLLLLLLVFIVSLVLSAGDEVVVFEPGQFYCSLPALLTAVLCAVLWCSVRCLPRAVGHVRREAENRTHARGQQRQGKRRSAPLLWLC